MDADNPRSHAVDLLPKQTRPQRSSPISRRLTRRILQHLLLCAISAGLVLLIAQSFTAPPRVRLSAATAFAGLILLAVTLILGPLNILRLRPNPVSTDLRRDCGIWAAILGITHTVLALWTPLQGAFWRAFAIAPERLRFDSLGFANDLGLVASFLLVLLVTLSNDRSLRWLGRTRWKAAQRLSYPLFGFVVFHTLLYQRLVQPGQFYQFLLALVVVLVVALQANGWLERRSRRRR